MNESIPPPAPAPPELPPPTSADAVGGPMGGALPAITWGPGQTLIGLAALLMVVIAGSVVIDAFDPDLESLGSVLGLQTLLAVSLAGVAFLVARPGSLTPAPLLGLRRPPVPSVKPAIGAYLVYIACAIVIALLLAPEQDDVTQELGYGESDVGDVVIGFFIIGVAPVTEELFFRGFMFGGMRRQLPFAAAAAIPSAIWGLFHFTGAGTWGVVLQLAVFGLVLSWLYERTGSIWPCIAVHAFNNALAFAILTS